MAEVTDPDILSQLNATPSPAGMQPVADPNILAQLNGSPSSTIWDKLGQTWPVKLVKDVYSAAQLPGDVYSGKTQLPSLGGVPGSAPPDAGEVKMQPGSVMQFFGADPSSTWSAPGHDSAIARANTLASIIPTGVLPSVTYAAPAVKDLVQTGGQQISDAVNSGMVLAPNKIQDAIDTIRTQLPDRRVSEDTHAALDALEQKTGPLTFKDFKQARDELMDVQANAAKSTGRTSATDLRSATIAKHGLDDIVAGTPEGDLFAEGNANVSGGKAAEGLDRRLYKSELKASSANSGNNIGNTIKSNVASMLTSKDARTMSPEIRQQAENLVYGSGPENFMRHWGNVLGGGGGLGQAAAMAGSGGLGYLASGGSPTWAGIAATTLPVAGAILKHGANETAVSNLEALSNALRSNTPLGATANRGNYFDGAMPGGTAAKAALVRALMSNQTQQPPQ